MAEVSILRINNTSYNIKDAHAVRYYNTVAAMAADTTIKLGQSLCTLGYHSVDDGGGALYTVEAASRGFSEALTNGLYAILEDQGKPTSKQLGMWGDGTHDDSTAFTAALSYLSTSGIDTLYMDAGLYNIQGSFTIPYGIRIVGPCTPRIPTWQNNQWNMNDLNSAVFSITGNEGVTTYSLAPFCLKSYSSLVNVGFWYPNQPVANVTTPVLYPPTIALVEDSGEYENRNCNVLLDNITFGNSYIGISAEVLHERFTFRSSSCYAFKNILIVDNSIDIDRIMNIHVNMTGSLYDQLWPAGTVRGWQFNSGVENAAFHIKGADALVMEEVFVYGFQIPFLLRSGNNGTGTDDGARRPNGITLRNCASEGCVTCFKAEGIFTRLKLIGCSFGVNATNADVAIRIQGAYDENTDTVYGKEIYISDTTVWRSNNVGMNIRNCQDIMLSNVAILQITNTGEANTPAALLLSNCRKVTGSNITINMGYNSAKNAYYIYMNANLGALLDQISCYGLGSQNASHIVIAANSKATVIRNIVAAHAALKWVSGSTTNCSCDNPINYNE